MRFTAPVAQDPMLVVVYFVPRVTIVLVVEVFSYFFLNLYRTGLSDLKFYHNELTGIEARRVAMQFAARSDDKELVSAGRVSANCHHFSLRCLRFCLARSGLTSLRTTSSRSGHAPACSRDIESKEIMWRSKPCVGEEFTS